jgi:hypothetical protein
MTKQIPDRVKYKSQEFVMAGLNGTGLFIPGDFGISSEMMGITTACYRGYYCTYECIGNLLFLVELVIVHRHGKDIELPVIEAIPPKSISIKPGIILFNYYQELKIPCPFSGGLILTSNPINAVGHFPAPIEFETVIEILVQEGILQKEIDHSCSVAGLRKQITQLDEMLKSNTELAEVLRKRDLKEIVSDPETRLFQEYIEKINKIRNELEWSFVSGYKQQPSIQ